MKLCLLADVWLLPIKFRKNQTRWYTYTWVLFSTHVWILSHMYGKRHTCVKKATQLYDCKCLAFSTHVWEKPPTCLFPPELSVPTLANPPHSHPIHQKHISTWENKKNKVIYQAGQSRPHVVEQDWLRDSWEMAANRRRLRVVYTQVQSCTWENKVIRQPEQGALREFLP